MIEFQEEQGFTFLARMHDLNAIELLTAVAVLASMFMLHGVLLKGMILFRLMTGV